MNARQRFALVGVGQRAQCFADSLVRDHAGHAELVGLCDSNLPAARAWQAQWGGPGAATPLVGPADFEAMLHQQRVQTVLITTPDHTHDEYICRAMAAGCDVVTEKPLTTAADKCQRIVDAADRTQRACRVALNYRYAPWNSTIKQLLIDGVIGRITSCHLRQSLGHLRGGEYFHRWHAEWDKSGGLLVHKSTHYLDLMNWWIGSVPRSVYARARQAVFTADNARALGLTHRADRCADCGHASVCPFHRAPGKSEPVAVESARRNADGYSRDLCVFRPEATIPDTMQLIVEYENDVLLNYTLTAYGQRDSYGAIEGTHGRLLTNGVPRPRVVSCYGESYDVTPPEAVGGHGGGDPAMFNDIYNPHAPADPLLRMASHHAGAWSALIGIAANHSIKSGQPVLIRDLVHGLQVPDYPAMNETPRDFTTAQMRAWVDHGSRPNTPATGPSR